MFDFNKIVKLRQNYPFGCQLFHTEDSLLDAILDDKYPYEYALLHGRCLEKEINKEKFFTRYHPDVMIKIGIPGLHHFILVHLNINPVKILMGVFFKDATAIGSTKKSLAEQAAKSYLEVELLNHFIGEHKKNFRDFQNNVSKFANGDDINRGDMEVIKYSEFDIKYINPLYYFPLGIDIRNELPSEMRRFLQNRGDINDDSFDFTEVIRLRMKYPCGAKEASGEEDALLNAILNNEYTYKYALLNIRWLEKNRKRFFTIYHPNVMIRIRSLGLEHFFLVHLNTAKPSKILTGTFEGKIVSDEIRKVLFLMWRVDLGIDMLSDYIGEYEEDFCDFQDNILKFLNGNNDINRKDINVIEYDEFNIYDIYPASYTGKKMGVKKKTDEKYHKFLKEHGDTDGFDFNKIVWLRAKYSYGIPPFDEPRDNLFDAIEDGAYKYEYALFRENWLKYNKKKFFAKYHPDVMIRINSMFRGNFILVHLKTTKPAKILTGVFKGNAYALDVDPNSKPNFHNHIGEHEEDFCDFQSNILKFVNGNNDINRKDMNVIKYDELDVNHIDPFYYSKENIKINKLVKKYCNSGDIHTFDFNKIVAFRLKEEYSNPKDLFDAIQNNKYTYKYVLLEKDWLERGMNILVTRDYSDIIINIDSEGLNQYLILHLNAAKPSKILTGTFKGKAYALDAVLNFDARHLSDYIGERHEKDFCDFLNNISKFLNGNNNINRNDMNIIKYDEFDINHIHPLYYSKQAIEIRNEIEEKDYKVLTDYVDLIDGPIVSGIKAKCLNENNFVYPLKYDDIKEEELLFEVVKIQKEDIIHYYNKDKVPCFYLYNLDNNDVYIDTEHYKILRCKDKKYTSYIVNYLNDKQIQTYITTEMSNNIKIISPTKAILYITDKFQQFQMYPDKIVFDEISKIIRKSNKIKSKESQKIIKNIMIENISNLKLKALKSIITDDLEEVKKCHKNGTYKSAVILCGSILEAFLLDWLAEKEESRKKDDLTLENIINKINSITPEWNKNAKNAHYIRNTRNIVHPKKYIGRHKISEKKCQGIIDCLENIMATR